MTFTALVVLPTGSIPTGKVTFDAVIGGSRTNLGIIALDATGKANFSTAALPQGIVRITAAYPDTVDPTIGIIYGSGDGMRQEIT